MPLTPEQIDEVFKSFGDERPDEARINGNDPVDSEITRLAKLSTVEYENQRKGVAEILGLRASILDKLVAAERARLNPDDGSKQGHAIAFPDPEPWPDPVAGAALLDNLAAAIRKYVVLSDHARDACALWVVHTYLTDRFLISPRLGVRSPTKGCGKTLLIDILDRLVARSLPTANVTAAAIFRVIEAHRPTLLVDEADTFLYDNDELRGVLNSGHRKGGAVLRTVGDDYEPRSFATYSPCVIALIGALPDTLHDRAVIVDLKRRLPSEKVDPFRPDRAGYLDVLARTAVRWAKDSADRIGAADPVMPAGIINREADNWRPLLAIADVAGGEWPERARKAAEAAHIAAADDAESRLELLLGDIRDAFANKAEMASADLVKALVELEGRPWAELGKTRKPLTQNGLARRLKPLGIAPQKIGPGTGRLNGYARAHFEEAFGRYLGPDGGLQPDNRTPCDEIRTSEISQPDSPDSPSPVEKREKPNNDGLESGCPVAKGGNGDARASRPLDGGVGVSAWRIRQLAEQYQDLAYANAQANGGDTLTADCDAWLRRTLAEEGVFPEFVEVEFERVMDEVFRI
jgi:putative DNA primase/helicase